MPVAIDGVDNSVLQPRQTWADASEYDRVADDLAARFRKNFEQYSERAGETVVNAGPQA